MNALCLVEEIIITREKLHLQSCSRLSVLHHHVLLWNWSLRYKFVLVNIWIYSVCVICDSAHIMSLFNGRQAFLQFIFPKTFHTTHTELWKSCKCLEIVYLNHFSPYKNMISPIKQWPKEKTKKMTEYMLNNMLSRQPPFVLLLLIVNSIDS